MSDRHDEKLEAMLRSRRLEAASPDLAERIALKAQAIPQRQNVTLAQWVRRICAELHLPRPAYVLAGALLVGIAVGINLPPERSLSEDADNFQVQSFLYADEGVL